MNRVTIRRLRADDATLAANALNELKPSNEPEARRAGKTWCQSFLRVERNILIAALCDAKPIGFTIAYLLDRAERSSPVLLLYEIEVTKAHRLRGIGRAMVERLKEVALEHGAYKMWVLTDPANHAARALYRASGGTEAGSNLLIEWTGSDIAVRASDGAAFLDEVPTPQSTA
jgi:GNAT superfamily N-acetyltransferase